MVNTNLLKGKIVSAGLCLRELAIAINMGLTTLSAKVNGKREFTAEEIVSICKILGISSRDEMCDIFFAGGIPKTE